MDNFSDKLTLEGAGGQTDDTRSTFKVPLKTRDSCDVFEDSIVRS